jgi:hypothetical protein|tara:strand:- start:1842 stop:2198 length:357 start_codon:yes stop_codon:yes gene_type:complete
MVVLLTLGGLKPCGAETTATSGGGLKRRYLLEGRLNHGHNHELGDTHTGFYVKECCASVPARDHEFALVIRINQADEVAQYNAVFMAKARPWQNYGGSGGVAQMDRKARWNQGSLSRL